MENENLLTVNGRLYTQIDITPQTAIEVMFDDCILHGKNILESDEHDEKSIEIFKALSILKKNYSATIGKNRNLTVNSVFDSTHMQFYITSREALFALCQSFFRDFGGRIGLCTSAGNNEKRKGVYSYYDASYHGSADWKYSLVYPGIEAEETLKALNFLQRNYYNFINENKESQTKHR